jgi:hypothetical protein
MIGAYVWRQDGFLALAFAARIVSGTPSVPPTGEIQQVGWFDPTVLPRPATNLGPAMIVDALASRRGMYREL